MKDGDLGDRLRALDDGQAPTVPRRSRKDADPRLFHAIDTTENDLKVLTMKAWDAIEHANTRPYLFAHGRTPVRTVTDPDTGTLAAEDLTVDTVTQVSAEVAYWHKLAGKGGYMQPVFPPPAVMRNLLATPSPPLPQLRRIIRAPVCGPQGQLATEPGYHPDTGHLYDAQGLVVPPVPPKPTAADIDDALTVLLEELLVDFPFTSRSEIAHALSLVLNPFVRDLIGGPTPMYVIESPTAGTGKGLLARIAILPALGANPTLMTQSDNEEETRKRITGTLVGLPEAILIDNIADGLDSPNLAAVLTTNDWSDRILGRSETRTMPVRCTWIATGNNPTKSSELARRTIRIRIDAKVERPEERKRFKHPNIERWAKANRGALVHAALVLVQGWVAAGMPRSEHTLGSYDDWAAVHGGILQIAGVNGFLENRTEDRQITVAEDAAWSQFTADWWDAHKDAPVGVADLFELGRKIDDFPLGGSPSERGQRTAFGKQLSRNRNRIFGGREITYAGIAHNLAQYRLTSIIPDF